jgi:small subunit ribosomal protein S8e
VILVSPEGYYVASFDFFPRSCFSTPVSDIDVIGGCHKCAINILFRRNINIESDGLSALHICTGATQNMSVWHGTLRKRKLTGGRKRAYRVKRKFEQGTYPAETTLGKPKRKRTRGYGGNTKIKLLTDNQASVTDPKTGKTEKTTITRVISNKANVDYNRRGVITKGAEIETALGTARVTSRPGIDGVINAILISGKEEKA